MTSQPGRLISVEKLLAETGWLRGLAARLVRDPANADDLSQGALTAAIARPPTLGRPLRPWLASIARNLARRMRREESRRDERERRAARSERIAAAPDEILCQFEQHRQLARLVAQLDTPHREVILRRFWRGESSAEIARATGTPVATVRARLARALDRLREAHRRSHGGGVAGMTFGSFFAMKSTAKLAVVLTLVSLAILSIFAVQNVSGTPNLGEESLDPVALTKVDGEIDAGSPDDRADRDARREVVTATESSKTTPVPNTSTRTALALRAVDELGEPIAGARVVFVERGGLKRDLPGSPRSGDDGRIVLDVPAAATFRFVGKTQRLTTLQLEAPGFATLRFVEGIAEGVIEELGDRQLAVGVSLGGRVVDAQGRSVEGAAVIVRAAHRAGDETDVAPSGIGPRGPEESVLLPRTVTDANGRFVFEGLEIGTHQLWYQRQGRPWNVSEAVELLPAENRLDLVLPLRRVPREQLITGRVMRPDGSPARWIDGTGTRVRWRAGIEWMDYSVPVDAEGRFEIVARPGRAVDVLAYHTTDAFGPSSVLETKAGDSAILLALTPARYLNVRAVRMDGTPLRRAWLLPLVDGSGHGRPFARTDSEGRCRILAPAEPFMQRVGCSGFVYRDLGPFDPNVLPEELVVRLKSEPALHGVVRAAGRPVEGARVDLVRSTLRGQLEILRGFTSHYFGTAESRATTDAEGRFRIPAELIPRSSYALLCEKDGFARAEHVLGAIESVENIDDIVIELGTGGTLAGRVFTGRSTSSNGVVVACSREDGRPYVTRTDAKGRYRFEHLTEGPWLVESRASEPAIGRSTAAVPREDNPFLPNAVVRKGRATSLDLDLRWQEGLRLRGQVLLDGAPAAGWRAAVESQDGIDYGLAPGTLDDSGHFDIATTPGAILLVIRSRSRVVDWRIEHELDVGPSQAPVVIRLSTGTLSGDGQKPDQRLRARSEVSKSLRVTVRFDADAQGSFEKVRVPTGPLRVERQEMRGRFGLRWIVIARPSVIAGGDTVVR